MARVSPIRSLMLGVVICGLVGCGGSGGVERFGVAGTVTFEGKPVPFGSVKIEPDRKKGGSGPAGFAQIRDGKFDTAESGRGSVKGPMLVTVQGVATDAVYAQPIFKPYQTAVEVGDDNEPLEIVVPDELKLKTKKAPAGPDF